MNQVEKVLVTGSNGFVGRNLVSQLRRSGYEVITFDLENGDIAMDRLNYSNVKHVFHLASKVYVPASWENTFDFYRTNVMGTTNVLELCRANHCSLTYISSYVYGTPQYLPVDEKHPVSPASPYNHSKLMAEEICKYYAQTFDVPVVVLRPVNIYGPGQNISFLVPEIIQQVLNKSRDYVEVMDLRPKRDFLYIDDFINAIISTIHMDRFDIFNIGSGYSLSVEEIIKTTMHVTGISKPIHSKKIERKNEVWDVYVNIQKFKDTFHWEPKISFGAGIKKCLEVLSLS